MTKQFQINALLSLRTRGYHRGCSAEQDHVLDVLDHHHAGHARRVLVVLDVVAGHRHRGQHVHHHEDPLEDGEVRGEDDGGEQRGHAEGEVVQRAEIFILLQPQCVEVDGRNCLEGKIFTSGTK